MASSEVHSSSATHDLTAYFGLALLVTTTGPLLFGYHLAELNPPELLIRCLEGSGRPSRDVTLPQCIPMSGAEFGLVSSIFTLGGLIGALSAGPVTSRIGRLSTLKYTVPFAAIGPAAESLAMNITVLALGRFISGIAAGVALVVVPIYLSEVSPPLKRGIFGSATQIMANSGILISLLLGFFLSRDQLWRIILGVAGLIGVLQFAGLFLIPESPRWAAEHGRAVEARRDLQKLRGLNCDIQEEMKYWKPSSAEPRVGEEETLLHHDTGVDGAHQSNPRQNDEDNVGILACLLRTEHRRATLSVMLIHVTQQFCGINSIVMYGVGLLSGLLTTSSALVNVFVALLNLIVTMVASPLVEKLGRKPCLLISIAGMGTSSLLIGIALQQHLKILAAVAVCTFVASFGIGLGPIPFILAAELASPQAVSATQSWALAANWVSTFIVSQLFPILNNALGSGIVYFIFAGLAALFFVAVASLIPETKGKRSADEVWQRGEYEPRNRHVD